MPTPTAIVAVQPARPRSGFGKPSSDPCHEFRFLVHPTSRLKLQDSWAWALASRWNLSMVSRNAAQNPMSAGDDQEDGEERSDGALL